MLEHLRTKLEAQINAQKDALASGSCKDWPACQHAIGTIKGLQIAIREIIDLETALKESDLT